jgi:hypothetical protein
MRKRLLYLSVLALAGCGGAGGGGSTGDPVQLVPNLRPEPASDLSIDQLPSGIGGQRILRLSSEVSNYGAGPMELFGQIQGASTSQPVGALQMVYWTNGQTTATPAGDFNFHPEHGHWHWENLVSFKLLEAVNQSDPYDPANSVMGTTPKVSYCLVDGHVIPGFVNPAPRRYMVCNTNRQGISKGWTDIYTADLEGQWIVIDGVPDGIYWVVLESDPEGFLVETDENDNRSAVKIQISGNDVTVLP